MRVNAFRIEEVVSFPKPLEEGVLYVSKRFAASAHNCACGCGMKVILGLNPAQWTITRHPNGAGSLAPSVDNSSFPCRSHYWIRAGRVDWHGSLTPEQARNAKARDAKARKAYYRQSNSPWRRFWAWLRATFTRSRSRTR